MGVRANPAEAHTAQPSAKGARVRMTADEFYATYAHTGDRIDLIDGEVDPDRRNAWVLTQDDLTGKEVSESGILTGAPAFPKLKVKLATLLPPTSPTPGSTKKRAP
jgi:hypothetical protein